MSKGPLIDLSNQLQKSKNAEVNASIKTSLNGSSLI